MFKMSKRPAVVFVSTGSDGSDTKATAFLVLRN